MFDATFKDMVRDMRPILSNYEDVVKVKYRDDTVTIKVIHTGDTAFDLKWLEIERLIALFSCGKDTSTDIWVYEYPGGKFKIIHETGGCLGGRRWILIG